MKGKELKERIDELHIVARHIAIEMGVKESAMTGYYKSDNIRTDTLNRIDAAIRKLTKGRHGLEKDEKVVAPVPEPEPPAKEVVAPTEQQDALNYAARQVATMTRRLSDALTRIELRENELDKKEAKLDALLTSLSDTLEIIHRHLPDDLPAAESFIGNIDVAAEDENNS